MCLLIHTHTLARVHVFACRRTHTRTRTHARRKQTVPKTATILTHATIRSDTVRDVSKRFNESNRTKRVPVQRQRQPLAAAAALRCLCAAKAAAASAACLPAYLFRLHEECAQPTMRAGACCLLRCPCVCRSLSLSLVARQM